MKGLFIMLCLGCCFFTQAQISTKDTAVNWLTFSSQNYAISYPDTWKLDTSKTMGIDLFLFAPKDSVNDIFRENVNLLSSDIEENIGLDSFVNVSIRQIENMATGYQLIMSKRFELKKSWVHQLEFTAQQGKYDLHFMQYYFIARQKAYTITLTTEKNTFNAYKNIGTAILNSIQTY
ncbi:MAG: DcrB-related protein [Ferruginibacter sp.]